MRIAVNTRLLLSGKLDGIGWFTYETMQRITRANPEHQFLFFFDRPFPDEFLFAENIEACSLFPPARHPLLWYWWFEMALPQALRKARADIFFSPDGYLPLRSGVPSISVIHDINFHHRPQDLPLLTRGYYRHFFPRFARRADRIITVSEHSKRDIASSYAVPENKISVAHNGCSEVFQPISAAEAAEVKKKYASGTDYFVFVGLLHPRKNIPGLLRAYELFRRSFDHKFRLLVVGEKMFLAKEMMRTLDAMKHKDEVVFTGRLDQDELRRVYGAAAALTFVPFYEGFGIPIVEAMNCDIPVLLSEATSLPEVGGKAACYVDPYDPGSIAAGMLKIVTDQSYREDLIRQGRKQRDRFSWQRSAEIIWSVFESLYREKISSQQYHKNEN